MAKYVSRNYGRKRKGRRGRKRPWYQKKYSVMEMAGKALAGVKYLSGLVNAELHLTEDELNATSISSTGSVTNLVDIGQNDTASGRTGNSIFMRQVHAKGCLTIHPSATTTFVRCMWVIDNQQASDTAPSITSILQNSTVESFLSANNLGRFTVLADRVYQLSQDKPMAFIKYSRIMRHHIRYNGTSSNDIQKGGLYLVLVSNEPTNTPTLSMVNRLRWYDN